MKIEYSRFISTFAVIIGLLTVLTVSCQNSNQNENDIGYKHLEEEVVTETPKRQENLKINKEQNIETASDKLLSLEIIDFVDNDVLITKIKKDSMTFGAIDEHLGTFYDIYFHDSTTTLLTQIEKCSKSFLDSARKKYYGNQNFEKDKHLTLIFKLKDRESVFHFTNFSGYPLDTILKMVDTKIDENK